MHLPRAELILREVAQYEDEIFEKRRRREEGRERAAAARKVAEGGNVAAGAFGSLYPPRDANQKRLYGQMKGFADAEDDGSTLTLSGTLSGFHKASVHLYVTLLNLAESNGADGNVRQSTVARARSLGCG